MIGIKRTMIAVLAATVAMAASMAAVQAAPGESAGESAGQSAGDAPGDYTHLLPLSAGASQGVLRLRLPREVYLYARSPALDDLRVFDASGVPQPYALRAAAAETRTSRRDLPVAVFPLMGEDDAARLDLDVSTATDGRLLSVKVKPERQPPADAPPTRLIGLILDLGGDAGPVDALRFTPPPDRRAYSAQVWLETSDDMKRWDTVGAAELNWLVNQEARTLANDRLAFDARRFRYARLTWRGGQPMRFATVTAEQAVQTRDAMPAEQLLLRAAPGRTARELTYAAPVAIAPDHIGLQFEEANIVLAATLGLYREAPPRQPGQAPGWRYDPLLTSTFYRITQGGQVRASGDLAIAPVHSGLWVLRATTPDAAIAVRPALRLSWQPATLIFLANGNGPYTLAVGRERAPAAARPIGQVAPGFSDAELARLEQASAGPVRQQQGGDAAGSSQARQAAAERQWRLLALWGVLALGVAVLAFMVWRLLRPAAQS